MRLDFLAIWLEALSNTFRGPKKEYHEIEECLNCQSPVDAEQTFCAVCGQKIKYSYVTIWSLFGEFFSNLFNLDNTIFRSLKMLWVPGFLSKEYMEGRRKQYINPVRLFFVALVIFFAILSFVTDISDLDMFIEENAKRIGKSELKQDYLTWKDSLAVELQGSVLDSLETQLLENIEEADKDSMDQNMELLGINMRDHRFLRKDLYEMDIDTLLSRYEIEKFWERLVISQYARAMRNPSGAVQFFIGNMLWGIISTIFILGLFMKLLYIRRKKYYVEHVVVLFNTHTFAFVILGIVSIIAFNVEKESTDAAIILGACGLVLLYIYLSLRRYYEQGYIKTFIKLMMMLFLYLFIIIVMIGVVLVASILLYK